MPPSASPIADSSPKDALGWRRTAFRRTALALLALLAGVSPAAPSAVSAADEKEKPKAKKPDVVIVLTDDMGFSDLGCYGGEISTPNLDALAAGGVRFTQFYNTARCCPTRASLLTGLHPHQAHMGHMTGGGPKTDKETPAYAGDLSRSAPTIAEALKPAGYRSYAVGKWHVSRSTGSNGSQHNWPLQRGFEKFYGMLGGAGSYYDPSTLCRGNQLISAFADPEYQPSGTYYFTDAIADHAVKFVADHDREHKDEPFFLYVAFTAAHWPMHALPEDVAKYKGKYSAGYDAVRQARFEKAAKLGLIDSKQPRSPVEESWEEVKRKEHEASYMEVYAAMVDRMDQGVGKLTAELKRSGRFENTLFFYLQDNGGCAENIGRIKGKNRVDGPRGDAPTLPLIAADALPQGQPPAQTRDGYPVRQGPNVEPGPADTYVAYGRGWANVSNTPFREYKHWTHEGGISTPLIVSWPAGIAPAARGALRKQPGQLPDLLATCLDVAGAKFPEKRGELAALPPEGTSLVPAIAEDKALPRTLLYWEHEGNRAVRDGDWKLVAKGPGGAWELYDLSADRVESKNLASAHPDRVEKLASAWEAWAARTGAVPWIWKPAYRRAGSK